MVGVLIYTVLKGYMIGVYIYMRPEGVHGWSTSTLALNGYMVAVYLYMGPK